MRAPGRIGGGSLLVAAVLLHAGSWFAMVGSDRSWTGSWKDALDWAAGSVIIVGPLLAALTAWSVASWRRTSLPDLAVGSSHPVRAWFDPALRLYLVCLASFGLLLVELTGYAVVAGLPVIPRQLVVLPLCILMLAVHGLVGMALGLRLPPRLAGVVAGPVSFLLFLGATTGWAPKVFETGGVAMTGSQYRLSSLAVLTLIAVLLVAASVALACWPLVPEGGRPFAIVPVVGVVIAFLLGGADVESRLEPGPAVYVCAGARPQLCLLAEAPHRLDRAAPELDRLAEPLRRAGAELPATWRETSSDQQDLTVGSVWIEQGPHSSSLDVQLISALAQPASCGWESETVGSGAVRERLSRWIAYRNHLGNTPHAKAWYDSAASEAWVRTTYAQLRRCDVRDVRLP